MTTTNTQGADDLFALIEAYAELRHKQGYGSYNANTYAAWQAVKDAIAGKEATHLRELAAYRLTVENLEREIAQQPAPSPAPAVDEQSAFEDWLTRKCPTGDAESVQRRWVTSSEYREWMEQADTQPAPAPAPVQGEREAFEAWCKTQGWVEAPSARPNGTYVNGALQARWLGWQGRAARAPADSVQEDAARWRDWTQAFAEASAAPEDTVFMKAFEDAIGDSDAPFTAEQFTSWVDAALKQGEKH